MPDTDEALAVIEQSDLTDAELKDFFYAVRGLKRKLYTHVYVPTTKDPDGPKILNHRCQVCKHDAVGDAEISHHRRCALQTVQEEWHTLKAKRPDLFDFSDRFKQFVAEQPQPEPPKGPADAEETRQGSDEEVARQTSAEASSS